MLSSLSVILLGIFHTWARQDCNWESLFWYYFLLDWNSTRAQRRSVYYISDIWPWNNGTNTVKHSYFFIYTYLNIVRFNIHPQSIFTTLHANFPLIKAVLEVMTDGPFLSQLHRSEILFRLKQIWPWERDESLNVWLWTLSQPESVVVCLPDCDCIRGQSFSESFFSELVHTSSYRDFTTTTPILP